MWAALVRDTILPASHAAYDQNDLAMDAYERLQTAILTGDRDTTARELDTLADALETARAALAGSHRKVVDMERHTGPLNHLIDPPPRPRESRKTRLAREEQLPE
ncbi:MAG: hypothetical protein ACOX61_01185 [Brooklawnia sp.]